MSWNLRSGVLAQTTLDDLVDLMGNLRNQGADGHRFLAEDCSRDACAGLALERALACEHLIQHGSEAEDVGSRIHSPSLGLLWRM